eukprot:1008960-Prymnesium_polylepis.1
MSSSLCSAPHSVSLRRNAHGDDGSRDCRVAAARRRHSTSRRSNRAAAAPMRATALSSRRCGVAGKECMLSK